VLVLFPFWPFAGGRGAGVITRAAAWVKLSNCHLDLTRRARGIYGSNCHFVKHGSNCHFVKHGSNCHFLLVDNPFLFCVGIPGGGRGNLGQIVKLSRRKNRTAATLAAYKYTHI
jgi:hypothetical protein